ncbi:MAG: S-layer homology domain-containing protein [Clostridiales bacterium]|nr:S-layer homology domain-containing protein [Clostridiales bacterium]
MKKFVSLFLVSALSFSQFAFNAMANNTATVSMQIGNTEITVNGESQPIDENGTTPVIIENRTLLPIRAFVEGIGGSIEWDEETKTVTINYNNDSIQLIIDSDTAYLNGEAQSLDSEPVIINGRTMLPIRFIAESFGFDVQWDEETQTITISNAAEASEETETAETAETTEGTAFADVSASYPYAEGINFCVQNGIIRRTAPDSFSPNDDMNRELFAYILYRLEGSPSVEDTVLFTDTEMGRWYNMGVMWAANSGLLNAYDDGSFGVNKAITKAELAEALWKYADSPNSNESTYTDIDDLTDEQKTAVSWAQENDILTEDTDLFNPNSPVTRGETADAVMKFVQITETPYMTALANEPEKDSTEYEFVKEIKITAEGVEGEAIVEMIDSRAAREFTAQLPMTVTMTDFGSREMFGSVPVPLSEEEALLSGYEVGDFSYGTPYDCIITFYAQDNEIIDGIIKLGEFKSGLDLVDGGDNVTITIERNNTEETD